MPALGYPQFEQVCFWTWRDRRPIYVEISTCSSFHQSPVAMSIPQRRHKTCVLLWRLPKLDVPFAVHTSAYTSVSPFTDATHSLWLCLWKRKEYRPRCSSHAIQVEVVGGAGFCRSAPRLRASVPHGPMTEVEVDKSLDERDHMHITKTTSRRKDKIIENSRPTLISRAHSFSNNIYYTQSAPLADASLSLRSH